MRVAIVLLGVVAAVLAGTAAMLLLGMPAGVALFVLVLVMTVYGGWFAAAAARRLVLLTILAVAVVALAFGGYTGLQLMSAFGKTAGAAAAPNPAALASANKKLDDTKNNAAFRLELTQDELTAVVQDGLQNADAPVRDVDLNFVGPKGAEPGALKFHVDFKNGSLSANGTVGYTLHGGAVDVAVRDVTIGAVAVPKPALSAIEDVVRRVADVNQTLAEQRMTVQSLSIEDGRMVLIGTSGNGKLVTSQAIVDGFRSRSQTIGQAKTPPAEKNGPGTVNAKEAPGSPVYVALGDSLAANSGVEAARDGYVSRFHNQIQKRDGKQYGLRNFGIGGETSATMLQGQLDAATAYMKGADVAYVTIDIGANDILAHLASDDCSGGADAPACKARIDASLQTYRDNIGTILSRLHDAAPHAKIVFLQTYNPFSFGFQGVKFEDDSDRNVQQINQIAADAAHKQGIAVADGFTPMLGLATAVTHMSDASPDIHPKALGYDILTSALLDAK